jgi:hypothetical protein
MPLDSRVPNSRKTGSSSRATTAACTFWVSLKARPRSRWRPGNRRQRRDRGWRRKVEVQAHAQITHAPESEMRSALAENRETLLHMQI